MRVLLVEDSEVDVVITKRGFEKLNRDIVLDIVSDGDAAMEYLEERRHAGNDDWPDLILLDINLPKMNGFDVLRAIREDSQFQSLIVIMFSSSRNSKDIARAYAERANSYLLKQTDFNEFLDTLECLIQFWIDRAQRPDIGGEV